MPGVKPRSRLNSTSKLKCVGQVVIVLGGFQLCRGSLNFASQVSIVPVKFQLCRVSFNCVGCPVQVQLYKATLN